MQLLHEPADRAPFRVAAGVERVVDQHRFRAIRYPRSRSSRTSEQRRTHSPQM